MYNLNNDEPLSWKADNHLGLKAGDDRRAGGKEDAVHDVCEWLRGARAMG